MADPTGSMRILHVGWGFSPWRPGGLINYAEDLMAAQVEAGHDVSYFFAGRHYPYVSGPRLKRWRRGGVTMHEIVNPPIVSGLENGTRTPALELDEPRTEAAFARLLDRIEPDVVHIQELVGLPSALIDVAAAAGVPTLMTLQDYYPLCATLRLFDADNRICTRLEVGADCVARNANAPTGPEQFVAETINYELARLRDLNPIGGRGYFALLNPIVGAAYRRATASVRSARAVDAPAAVAAPTQPAGDPSLADAFQRRRDLNSERLGRVGRLIAQSPRVAEIYEARGVEASRMTSIPFTLAHIEHLKPRVLTAPPAPITFVTLQGCAAVSKGSQVVVGALERLREAGLEGSFRLRAYGFVHQDVRPFLEAYEGVELPGFYQRDQLDGLLEDADVGLMPSIWEEALGYTGPEMLAKGIPLIANPLGGIVEYALEGRTAWLNRSCSGEGLGRIMRELIEAPALVLEMHRRVVAERDAVVVPMGDHVRAIEAEYRALAAARAAR